MADNKNGSDCSFEEKIAQNLSPLYNFVFYLTRNREDAQDLVQEATLRAYRFFHRYRQGTNFKAWIFTIARNLFINEYRRRKKEPGKIPLGGESESFIQLPQNISVQEEILIEQLKLAVDELPQELREAITLFYLEGFSYKDIAQIMDVPLGTVMSRLFTARQVLKKKMFVPDTQGS